jgi:hypothetical protein
MKGRERLGGLTPLRQIGYDGLTKRRCASKVLIFGDDSPRGQDANGTDKSRKTNRSHVRPGRHEVQAASTGSDLSTSGRLTSSGSE